MIINPYAFGVSYDPDAQAFFTASGLTGATNLTAINNLVVALKGFGIWTKMKAIYPMIGGTAALHKWNLKDPQDTNAAFRLVFNGGWTHSSTGALPNGVNGYADTFLSPNLAYSISTDAHLSFYSRTNNLANSIEIGCIETSPNLVAFEIQIRSPFFPNPTRSIINNLIWHETADTNSLGFYIANRSGTTVKNFKNNTNLGTGTNTVISRPIRTVWIGAQNFNGSINIPSTKQCAFSSIGDGLTDAEANNFYTAVQAYNTTLIRQV